jgi:hypothetical protein
MHPALSVWRGNVHGQILAQLIVTALVIDEDADLGAAMDIGSELALASMRTKRRIDMFSPILPTSAVRVDSTLPSPIGSADKAATSAGSCSATSAAQSLANFRKSSFLPTKSVSQLISIIAPSLSSLDLWIATTPSAVIRLAALLALEPSLTRRISSALPRSPAASVSARLHSIIGASVLSRSSFTILAVISAISVSTCWHGQNCRPWLNRYVQEKQTGRGQVQPHGQRGTADDQSLSRQLLR